MANSQIDEYHPRPVVGLLKIKSHRPIELAEAVKTHAKEMNQESKRTWQQILPALVKSLSSDIEKGLQGTDEALSKVKEIARAVSIMWLEAQMGDINITWKERRDEKGRKLFGSTGGYGNGVYIELHPQMSAIDIVRTLLHEQCHAVIDKYSCVNRFCKEKKCHKQYAVEYGKEEDGEIGHGTAWENLAEFVQDMSEDLFGEYLDMNIPEVHEWVRRSSSDGEIDEEMEEDDDDDMDMSEASEESKV